MRHGLVDADLLARSYAVTHPSGAVVLPHESGWDQLLYATSGVMRVETPGGAGGGVDGGAGGGVHLVPPHRALWLPDGAAARVLMRGRVAVRTLYLRGPAPLPPRVRTVDVAPLLRELVLHAVRECPLERSRPEHRRIVGMIGDQLAVAPQTPLQLPLPRDGRALRLARALESDPAGDEPLERLAAAAGASRRTLERLFVAQTGLTIGQWRGRLRLLRAVEELAGGRPVTAVAGAVGYATPSAFTAMFRAQLGASPRRYLGRGR